jgi:rubrerythrin
MGYEELMKKILALPKNETTKYALDLLKKLIADEKIHLKLFREWLKEN